MKPGPNWFTLSVPWGNHGKSQMKLIRHAIARSTFLAFVFFAVVFGVERQSVSAAVQDNDDSVIHIEAVSVSTLADNIDAGTGGLTVDKEGNLYSADFGWNLSGPGKGGDKIYKVSPAGDVKLFCREMKGASGNTIDADGNLYQSSIGGSFLSKISSAGKVTVIARQGLKNPVGVVLDDVGNLFVCNCGSNSIQKITPAGESTQFCNSKLLNCPNGITRRSDGTLYVCNFGNGDVIKIDQSGQATRLATLPGNNNGHLTLLHDKLYVIARTDNRVYKVGLDGTATYFVGSGLRGKSDGTPGESTFSLPNSIIASPDGKYLYVNETSPTSGDPKILGPTRIRKIELKKTVGGPAPKEVVVVQPDPELTKQLQQAQALLGKQKFVEAEKILRSAKEKYTENPVPCYLLGYTLHALKRYDEARELYVHSQTFRQLPARLRINSHYNVACTYALQNKPDEAFTSLNKAIEAGFSNFAQMQADADFANIKSDDRFKALIPKL